MSADHVPWCWRVSGLNESSATRATYPGAQTKAAARAGNYRHMAKGPALATPLPPASEQRVKAARWETRAGLSGAGAPIQRQAYSTPLSRPCALKAAWVKHFGDAQACVTRTGESTGNAVSCQSHARCKGSNRERDLHARWSPRARGGQMRCLLCRDERWTTQSQAHLSSAPRSKCTGRVQCARWR